MLIGKRGSSAHFFDFVDVRTAVQSDTAVACREVSKRFLWRQRLRIQTDYTVQLFID